MRMPASMAAAIGVGMRPISCPNGLMKAVSTISPPARMNEPTAAWMEMPLEAAINAAPGVDHAATTGMR